MPDDETLQKPKMFFGPYTKPNYTMVPDELFDQQLSYLSGSELKVLLYIIRRTFGFKKDADAISLNQICKGITTHDGKVLDQGTGLAKRHVISALKALAEMGLVTAERRSSPQKGFEPTVYCLNMNQNGNHTLVTKGNKGSDKRELDLVTKGNTQDTVLQQTDKQNMYDDDMAGLLEKFGVSKSQAQRLSTNYAPELIMEKLDLVQYLQSTNSPLVARNPQGWLIRAIDENYLPTKPKGFRSKEQREQEEQQRRQEEEEIDRVQQARQKAITSFIQNRAEKQIPGTKITTKTAWAQALEHLQKDISSANFNMWLRNTLLVDYEKDQALIGAPSSYVADWLQARMRSRVANALSNVVGRRVEVEFEAVPEMTRGDVDE